MPSRTYRHEVSFIVSIWRENEHTRAWRASVTHVPSRDRRYFTNYGDLCAYLDRWMASGEAGSD